MFQTPHNQPCSKTICLPLSPFLYLPTFLITIVTNLKKCYWSSSIYNLYLLLYIFFLNLWKINVWEFAFKLNWIDNVARRRWVTCLLFASLNSYGYFREFHQEPVWLLNLLYCRKSDVIFWKHYNVWFYQHILVNYNF